VGKHGGRGGALGKLGHRQEDILKHISKGTRCKVAERIDVAHARNNRRYFVENLMKP
jgi:hypothetical protein